MTSRSIGPCELQDIQGNVLRGYRHPHVAHLFGTICEANVQRWRTALAGLDVTREAVPTKPSVTRNVGISHAGMKRLVPRAADELDRFEAYASGMEKRAELLEDPSDVPWAEWGCRHVWIAVHAVDRQRLDAEVARLQSELIGLLTSTVLWGDALTNADGHRIEPFGFRDDISQPAIEGAPNECKLLRGGGKFDRDRKEWLPIAAGEFLLGHLNERGRDVLSRLPTIRPMLVNGTFAVFRELVQDVARFNETLAKEASFWRVPVDELKAKLIGRYPDGDSLVKRGTESDFTYDHDPDGARCPFGAHLRRANPRATGEHRMIRRGMPFHRKAMAASQSGHEEQGIYLVALNASIENQFEFIQSIYLNKPAGALPGSRDPLGSTSSGKAGMVIEGNAAADRDPIVLNLPRFVTCRGGEYYFVPGMSGLQQIARSTMA
jgi:Dyp-type peroxidase family